MKRKIILGRYMEGDSWVHRLIRVPKRRHAALYGGRVPGRRIYGVLAPLFTAAVIRLRVSRTAILSEP